MPDGVVRWRVQMVLEVSAIAYARDRQEIVDLFGGLLDSGVLRLASQELEVIDHDYTRLDPEPLCKCGRLPECCDCDE